MGLAFDLDALDLPAVDWFNVFILASKGTEVELGPYYNRWDGIFIPPPGEFDVIIRDVKQFDGCLVVVGGYRAQWQDDPHSVGLNDSGKYAWDGFVAVNRGFNWTYPLGSQGSDFKPSPFAESAIVPDQWAILPMRMPLEWDSGTAFDDNRVGLYGVDVIKRSPEFGATLSQNVGHPIDQLVMCGFGAVDPSSEGLPTGQDYVGAIYVVPVATGNYSLTDVQGATEPIFWGVYSDMKIFSAQYTWNCNDVNHIDNTPFGARFGEVANDGQYDLSEALGDNTIIVATGLSPPPSGDRLSARNRYPRRFLGISSVEAVIPGGEPISPNAGGPVIIVGDCFKESGGATDGSYPLMVYAIPAVDTNIVYPVLSGRTDENIQLEDTGVSYDLQGAWFRYAIPTTDFIVGDVGVKPVLLLAENVTHGASTSAEIYIVSGTNGESGLTRGQVPYIAGADPIVGNISILPYAVSGGSWETATGDTLPVRWTGFANQMRTFTLDEESQSKETFLPIEDENGTPVGQFNNYNRFGFTNATQEASFTPGVATNQVAVLMGVTISGGTYTPHVLTFDDGTIGCTVDTPGGPAPFTVSNTGYSRDYGITLRNQIISGGTNAYPVSASWDNDRDQWLFIYARQSGSFAIISCRSDFEQFIDQTDNLLIFTGVMGTPPNSYTYTTPSGYSLRSAGIYTARLMTNELDGIVIGGDFEDMTDTTRVSAIKPFTATFGSRYTNFTVIRGTTGRTARVWIDYVLYDGVDALVATKLGELGLRVTPENVEWFKGRILRDSGVDELDVKTEEIEEWMETQRKEYTDMLRTKERSGRLRKRKRQLSAYREGVEGALADANKSSVDSQSLDVKDLDDLIRDVGMPDDGYSSDRDRS